ncbi:MAG: 50S ribosomal protein L25, partial [Armatimonadetes bacterium]|nr:50S ribosomal protein L25 [Armatimonadota bacterium]
VTWEPLSIDLQWVSLAQEVEVTVPVVAVGEARGVKAGGILEQLVHELTVRCLPTAVPPHIEVDVSQMEIGDTLHVSDISPPEGVAILEAPNTAVVHVAAPRVAEELAAAAEAGAELAEGGEAVGADEGPSEEQ